jgi:hypothetical protein
VINKYLTKEDLVEMKGKLNDEVTNQFKKNYSLNSISSGKNYLTFEISKQFLTNFLNYEMKELSRNKKIKILALEKTLIHNFKFDELSFAVKIKGKIDRIDEVDGLLRIIDYKTGKAESKDLKILNWELLSTDEKYNKSFQVLLYAYMFAVIHKIDFDKQNLESGIISFKNLKTGFMRVNNSTIDQQTLDDFLNQLKKLLVEIYDLNIPFSEKQMVNKYY